MNIKNSNQQNRATIDGAQKKFNLEHTEFKSAKQQLEGLSQERKEIVKEKNSVKESRDNALLRLTNAENGGNAREISNAQQKLAAKNQNLNNLNQQLFNLKNRIPDAQLQLTQERKELNAARSVLNDVSPPEVKAEQKLRADVNSALSGLRVQVENGEPIGRFKDEVKKSLFENVEVPINKNLSEQSALKAARQKSTSPYFKAERDARLELVQVESKSVTKTYSYGFKEQRDRGFQNVETQGKVEVSVKFDENAKLIKSRNEQNQVGGLRKLTPEAVEKEKQSAFREMKLELAKTGGEEIRRSVELKDGSVIQLELKAEWKAIESAKINKSNGGDNDSFEWKSYGIEETRRNNRHDGETIKLPPSAKLTGIAEVKKIAADKAKTIGKLQEQLAIQGYIVQSRLEAVQSGDTNGFKDRKIIGNNVYEVEIRASFSTNDKIVNSGEPNFIEKRIQGNPLLTREEIGTMRENFSKGLQQAKDAMVLTLKEGLAISGEKLAEGTFTYKGEQHKITVKADWNVDAELHRTPDKDDVKRYLRELLLQNEGKEVGGKFFNHTAKGEADFDFDSKQLKSFKPSEMDLLQQRKSNLTASEFNFLKEDVDVRTKYDLSAAAQDMFNDLARTGDKEIKRVVTTSTGERHQLTVKADWDLDVKKIDKLKLGILGVLKFVGIAATVVATAGAGTPLAATAFAVGAGSNVLSSGLQGDFLGAGIGLTGFAGGLIGGKLGQLLQFGSGAARTVRGATDGDFTLGDALSVAGTLGNGLQILGQSANSIDAIKIGNTLLDIQKFGGYADAVIRKDPEAIFLAVTNEFIGATNRFKNNQENNNGTQQLLNTLTNPEAFEQGLRNGTIRAGITTQLREGVFNNDLNRVRQTYNSIYSGMDERGQAALDLIERNAERRGIDPLLAKAQVNKMLMEMSNLGQFVRDNAIRRGLPVEYSERILNGLLKQSNNDVDLAAILGAAKIGTFAKEKIQGFKKDLSGVIGNLGNKNIQAAANKLQGTLNISTTNPNGTLSATTQEIENFARQLSSAPTINRFNELLERFDRDSQAAVLLRVPAGDLVNLINGGASVLRNPNVTPSERLDVGAFSRSLGRAYELSPYQPGGGNVILQDLLFSATTSNNTNLYQSPGLIYTSASDIGLIVGQSGNSRFQRDFANSALDRSLSINNDGRNGFNRIVSNDLIVGAIASVSNEPSLLLDAINNLSPQNRERTFNVLVNSASSENRNASMTLSRVFNNVQSNESFVPFFFDAVQQFSSRTDPSVLDSALNYFSSESVSIVNTIAPDNSKLTLRASQLTNFFNFTVFSSSDRIERAFADNGSLDRAFANLESQVFANPNDRDGAGAARTAASRMALLIDSIGNGLANNIERGGAVSGLRERLIDLVVDKVLEYVPGGSLADDLGVGDGLKDFVNNGLDTEAERREFVQIFNSGVRRSFETVIDNPRTPEWQRERLDIFLNRMNRILADLESD